jgi:hypothetical protein
VNVLLHKSQQYWRSPLCKRLCFIRWLLEVNGLLHTSQQYGRSPLCTRLCVMRSLFLVNVLLQTSQQNGRSPLCKRLCVIRLLFWVNVLLHTSQQYGRSPLCKCLCVIKLHFLLNALLHTLLEFWCSSACALSCSFQLSCQKSKGYTLWYLLKGMCKIINFWIWKPAHSKQCNEQEHTTKQWMFQLTVLNGSIICTDYLFGPWTFISYINKKNTGVRMQTYGKFQFTGTTKYRYHL